MKSAQLAASSAESPKVKAPMTPYITFCVEKRSEIRTMYPDANFSDIGRMLGQIWGSMTADEKQVDDNHLHFVRIFSSFIYHNSI